MICYLKQLSFSFGPVTFTTHRHATSLLTLTQQIVNRIWQSRTRAAQKLLSQENFLSTGGGEKREKKKRLYCRK